MRKKWYLTPVCTKSKLKKITHTLLPTIMTGLAVLSSSQACLMSGNQYDVICLDTTMDQFSLDSKLL